MTRPGARAAVLGALLLLFLWNSLYYAPYVVDDAFISMRYARNLVAGHGLVFNPGEQVEGYSNFLWVLLEAALLRSGAPILTGVKLLGVASGVATVWMTYALGRVLFAERPALALTAAALLAFDTNLAVWTQAGLETAFFAALIVGASLRFELERRRPGGVPWSALVFALAWLTRPEAPVYALYFVLRRAPRNWWLTLAAVVIPYEAWGLWYYGALFPNTHAAKLGGSVLLLERVAPAGLARSQLVRFFVSQGWGFGALAVAGAVGCLRRARAVPAAAWAPVVSGTVFLLYAWTDWMPRFRFVVPFLPAFYLLTAHGIFALVDGLRPRATRLALGALLALAFLGHVQHQWFSAYYRERPRRSYEFAAGARGAWWLEVEGNLARTIYPVHNSAWTILELAPRRETVALADIGLPGYLTMNPVWDLRGLVTPIATRARLDEPAGRAAAIDDLLERRVALLLFPPGANPGIVQLEEDLRRDPRVQRLYTRVESDDGARVRYARADLPERIPRGRVLKALEGFPGYDSARAREHR